MVLKTNFTSCQGSLEKEPEWQLSQLSFDQSADGLVGKGENLLTLLLPFFILKADEEIYWTACQSLPRGASGVECLFRDK